MRRERERMAVQEARQRIRIEDCGDDVCITIDGICSQRVTDVSEGIKALKEIRARYIERRNRK